MPRLSEIEEELEISAYFLAIDPCWLRDYLVVCLIFLAVSRLPRKQFPSDKQIGSKLVRLGKDHRSNVFFTTQFMIEPGTARERPNNKLHSLFISIIIQKEKKRRKRFAAFS